MNYVENKYFGWIIKSLAFCSNKQRRKNANAFRRIFLQLDFFVLKRAILSNVCTPIRFMSKYSNSQQRKKNSLYAIPGVNSFISWFMNKLVSYIMVNIQFLFYDYNEWIRQKSSQHWTFAIAIHSIYVTRNYWSSYR